MTSGALAAPRGRPAGLPGTRGREERAHSGCRAAGGVASPRLRVCRAHSARPPVGVVPAADWRLHAENPVKPWEIRLKTPLLPFTVVHTNVVWLVDDVRTLKFFILMVRFAFTVKSLGWSTGVKGLAVLRVPRAVVTRRPFAATAGQRREGQGGRQAPP